MWAPGKSMKAKQGSHTAQLWSWMFFSGGVKAQRDVQQQVSSVKPEHMQIKSWHQLPALLVLCMRLHRKAHQCQTARGDMSAGCRQNPACLQTRRGSPEKVRAVKHSWHTDTPNSATLTERWREQKTKKCTSWATIECSSSSSGAASPLQLNSVHSSHTMMQTQFCLISPGWKHKFFYGCNILTL